MVSSGVLDPNEDHIEADEKETIPYRDGNMDIVIEEAIARQALLVPLDELIRYWKSNDVEKEQLSKYIIKVFNSFEDWKKLVLNADEKSGEAIQYFRPKIYTITSQMTNVFLEVQGIPKGTFRQKILKDLLLLSRKFANFSLYKSNTTEQ